MSGPTLEEINQDANTIGEVDLGISIEIVEADFASSIAGQIGGLAEKEMTQQAYAIGEVEASIAITITRDLSSTDDIVIKAIGDRSAAKIITDLQDREARGATGGGEDLQGLAIAQQSILGLVTADRDPESRLVKIKPDDEEGIPRDPEITLDMFDDGK